MYDYNRFVGELALGVADYCGQSVLHLTNLSRQFH